MNETELLALIMSKKNELEANRAANVSKSLIKAQEEEIRELEEIFATNDTKRLELRLYLDTCDQKKSEEEKKMVSGNG